MPLASRVTGSAPPRSWRAQSITKCPLYIKSLDELRFTRFVLLVVQRRRQRLPGGPPYDADKNGNALALIGQVRNLQGAMAWIFLLHVLLAPALLHAQPNGVASQSHYCATYNSDSQPEDCSFTSLQMCQESVSGLGGWCAMQSSAPAMPPPPLMQFPSDFGAAPSGSAPFAFPPAPVPPPQINQQPSGPLQLPDAQSPNGN